MCSGTQNGFDGCYAEPVDVEYPADENPGDRVLTAAMDDATVDLPLEIEQEVFV